MSNLELSNTDSPKVIHFSSNNFLSFGKLEDYQNPISSNPVSNFELISNDNKSISNSQTSKKSPKFNILLEENNNNDLNDIKIYSPIIKSSKYKSFVSNKKINCESSNYQFLKKKKKLMSSEEIELAKIKKEKEDFKKEKLKNEKIYKKSKKYIPMTITPSPLTILKPFHLSSSYSSKFLKKRMSSTDYEINKKNNKIRDKMKKKCDEFQKKELKSFSEKKSFNYLFYNDISKRKNNKFSSPINSKIIEKINNNPILAFKENNSFFSNKESFSLTYKKQ
jgi:hypothetical protein